MKFLNFIPVKQLFNLKGKTNSKFFFEKLAFYGLDMALEPEPEPELFRSRNQNHKLLKSRNRNLNHNFSKVETGTVKNSYDSTTL